MNSLTPEEYKDRKKVARIGKEYSVEHCDDPLFIPGMGVQVLLHDFNSSGKKETSCVGVFGVIHPEVLKNYDLTYPCSIAELNVDLLME